MSDIPPDIFFFFIIIIRAVFRTGPVQGSFSFFCPYFTDMAECCYSLSPDHLYSQSCLYYTLLNGYPRKAFQKRSLELRIPDDLLFLCSEQPACNKCNITGPVRQTDAIQHRKIPLKSPFHCRYIALTDQVIGNTVPAQFFSDLPAVPFRFPLPEKFFTEFIFHHKSQW